MYLPPMSRWYKYIMKDFQLILNIFDRFASHFSRFAPQKRLLSDAICTWSRIPDFLSSKGMMYIYADYRTENINGEEINIPRIKIDDGINPISKIPFVTMSITDEDMELWDGHSEQDGNDFENPIEIDSRYSEDNKFIFPTDGYSYVY